MRACSLALLFLLSALPGASRAATKEGSVRVGLESGLDTNPRRDFGSSTPIDAMGTVRFAADGLLRVDRFQFNAAYDLGGRKFLLLNSEDTLVQAASVEATTVLGKSLGIGLDGRIKHRRGGSRRYSDLASSAFLEYVPDAQLSLRLRFGAHRFVYPDAFDYSFGAPELGFTARYRFDRRHALLAFADGGARSYMGAARRNPFFEGAPDRGRRVDTAFVAGGGYSYRGPFAFSATYSYSEQVSNSFGEAQQRHRLGLTTGIRLPWNALLLAQAALQLSRYPDGVFLSPEIILVQDDENSNSLTLKLARPITEVIELELRYGLYQITLSRNDLSYLRHLGSAGVTARF